MWSRCRRRITAPTSRLNKAQSCAARVYTCFARFSVNANVIGTGSPSRYINTCGDERGVIIAEYHEYAVDPVPDCDDITTTGGSSHFTWSELNGGFSSGNPHTNYGMVSSALTSGLEATRTNYARGGIMLSSGRLKAAADLTFRWRVSIGIPTQIITIMPRGEDERLRCAHCR